MKLHDRMYRAYELFLLQCLILLAAFTILNNGLNGEMDFTYSAADLFRLIQTEQRISKQLAELNQGIMEFGKILGEISGQAKTFGGDPESIIKNPLLSYQLVKRHSTDLEAFDKTFETFQKRSEELHDSYLKIRSTFSTPKTSDLEYAMEAIIRLRQTYNFTVDELARGQLGKVKLDTYLDPEDLARIGLYAKRVGMLTNSRLFLKAALNQNRNYPLNSRIENMNWFNEANEALAALENSEESSPKTDREDFRILTEMDAMFATDTLENLNRAFEELCQYHAVKDPPVSRLKCYLAKSNSPFYRLFPLKIEVYHEDPQVIVIYDFMSDKEIATLEDATFYKLKRSLTQFYLADNLYSEPSIIRTTSQTWIHDTGHPTFGYLSKRIEAFTGYYLSGKHSAEELQIASYRPGGHYSLHTDATQEEVLKQFLQPVDLIQGDRLVTFMVYLTDVEVGGNTAFPMLNISRVAIYPWI